jgi:hypothetical protein
MAGGQCGAALPLYPQALLRLQAFALAAQITELSPRAAAAHAVRADPCPTVRTATAGSYRNRVRRALRPLAVRADPRPTVRTAGSRRYRHRALRTLRRLAVRAVCRPTIRTAAARPGRYRRRLAVGCAGSQHQRGNQGHHQRRERCAVRARLARETRTRRKHAPDIGGAGISAMAIANSLKKSRFLRCVNPVALSRGQTVSAIAVGAIAIFGSPANELLTCPIIKETTIRDWSNEP